MVSSGTMRGVSLQVALIGKEGVGRATFLKSLEANEDAKVGINQVEIQVRDIANSLCMNLRFTK